MTVDFKNLYDLEYTAEITRVKYIWQNSDNSNIVKRPRIDNGLMYFLDISGAFNQKDGKSVKIERGDIIYLPKGQRYDSIFNPHHNIYKNGINSYLIDFFLYDSEGNEFILNNDIIKLPIDNRKYHKIFDQINTLNLFENKPIMKIKGLFYTLLSDISNDLRNFGKNPETIDEIYNALLYIEENYGSNLSVPDIARKYNLSESTFRRYFKSATGLSPVDYIKKIRMERAESLLSSNVYSVKDVAELVGIPDPAYFSKVFKEYYGISPVNMINKRQSSFQ